VIDRVLALEAFHDAWAGSRPLAGTLRELGGMPGADPERFQYAIAVSLRDATPQAAAATGGAAAPPPLAAAAGRAAGGSELETAVRHVKEMLPDLGDGFVEACLQAMSVSWPHVPVAACLFAAKVKSIAGGDVLGFGGGC